MPDKKSDKPTAEGPDDRVNFGGRVRRSVRQRARVYAAQNDIDLQDLLDTALDDYLSRNGG